MNSPATTILTGVQKLQAILQLIPAINGVILNSFAQINQILPSAGLPGVSAATVAAVNKQVSDAIALVGDLGVEAGDLVNLFTNFATGISGIIAQVHAAQTAVTTAPPAVS